jgi:hypothetical protein
LAYDYTFADAVTVLHPEKTPESAAEAMTPALYTQYPSWMWENKLTHSEAEFYDLTKSMLENGNIRYELEYHATAGMNVTAADASNAELYQVTRQQPTSGRREVFAFEVDKSIADQVGDICITFTSEMDEGEFTVYTWKNEYLAMATEGNPIGEAKPVEAKTNSKKVTVHSLTAQQLDNGFVRYTVEFTTLAGRNVSFFTPPSGDIFMYFGDRTTGERDTLVVDIPQADHEAATDISMKFYDTSVKDNVFAYFKRATF